MGKLIDADEFLYELYDIGSDVHSCHDDFPEDDKHGFSSDVIAQAIDRTPLELSAAEYQQFMLNDCYASLGCSGACPLYRHWKDKYESCADYIKANPDETIRIIADYIKRTK